MIALAAIDGNWQAIVGTFMGVLVTSVFAFFTQRAAAKAAVRQAQVTSRTDIERDAFTRAEKYYQGVIKDADERQQRCNQRVSLLEGEVEVLKRRNEDQENRIEELEDRLRRTEAELETAKIALRLKYPDE